MFMAHSKNTKNIENKVLRSLGLVGAIIIILSMAAGE
jgi:hypothetical protein